jgi:dTDP-4-dehydrorhamnose reductase
MKGRAKRIVITGAAGMLASHLIPILQAQGHQTIPTDILASNDILYLNILDKKHLTEFFKNNRPDVVFHLAAKTNLEACEKDPEEAFAVNSIGTANVAEACSTSGALLIYLSTAGVFDGNKDSAYLETDIPNPINVYGKSKLRGEQEVLKNVDKYFIVRTSWLMGGGDKDYKFSGMILRQIMQGRKTIAAVDDKFGSPTYIADLSLHLAKLIDFEQYGLYHIANSGRASRYDVAKAIVNTLGYNNIEVNPVHSSYFQKSFPAPRPKCEVLGSEKLEATGLGALRNWRKGLDNYLKTEWSHLIT